jgi:DME family drug/metabolite transporter
MVRGRQLGVALVAIAAALWGLDALIRRPLAQSTATGTIVFGEHVVLVASVLPFLVPTFRALRRLPARAWLAAIILGAGSSAVATILFTQAFIDSDGVTPLVLQKVQPVIAVVAARALLGERIHPRFAWLLVPALVGTWLMTFPHPTHIDVHGARSSFYALGAAALWALGTVLGRYLSRDLSFEQVATTRFVFGLAGAAVALAVLGEAAWSSAHDSLWIAVLALVTGTVALALYYFGLARTPASTATIAELAFPVTAGIVGYLAFGTVLQFWQWVGVGLTSSVVLLLPTRSAEESVAVPDQQAPRPVYATG